MGMPILIVGETGSGKSRSIKNLPHEKTFLVNVVGKDLPFRGSRKRYKLKLKSGKVGNMLVSHDASYIIEYLRKLVTTRKSIEYIVIDDFQYILALTFTDRIYEGGWKKFNDLLKDVINIYDFIRYELPDNIKVFLLTHSEELSDYKEKAKAKTVGKAMDKYITFEGLFTIVLWTEQIKEAGEEGEIKHFFVTQSDGSNTAKSPEEMFDFRIDNDLYLVSKAIDEYYESE